jgi:hypothetical protein
MDERRTWQLVGAGSGLLAGMAVRKVLVLLWKQVAHDDPPANPAAKHVTWPQALMWTVSSGVALAVARLVAQRGAAEAWKAVTGDYPAALDEVA